MRSLVAQSDHLRVCHYVIDCLPQVPSMDAYTYISNRCKSNILDLHLHLVYTDIIYIYVHLVCAV